MIARWYSEMFSLSMLCHQFSSSNHGFKVLYLLVTGLVEGFEHVGESYCVVGDENELICVYITDGYVNYLMSLTRSRWSDKLQSNDSQRLNMGNQYVGPECTWV